MKHSPQRKRNFRQGFTLIEMMVSVTLFAIVVLVAVGALLALVGANHKAQALQSVMNNLNVSLDGMVRNIREGTDFTCSPIDDCHGDKGGNTLSVIPTDSPLTRLTYAYEHDAAGKGRIIRYRTGEAHVSITSPDVDITSMDFKIIGETRGDEVQPKVIIVIKGIAGGQKKTQSEFHIQATAVQRVLDL